MGRAVVGHTTGDTARFTPQHTQFNSRSRLMVDRRRRPTAAGRRALMKEINEAMAAQHTRVIELLAQIADPFPAWGPTMPLWEYEFEARR